jgi:hypothetical protein
MSEMVTKYDESAVSNAGVDGEEEEAPKEPAGEPWKPLQRRSRAFTYVVARSADGERVLNTIDIAPHFELSV